MQRYIATSHQPAYNGIDLKRRKKNPKRNFRLCVVCIETSPCPACARVRSNVYIKWFYTQCCVWRLLLLLCITVGGWDAYCQISLSVFHSCAQHWCMWLRLCGCVCDVRFLTLKYHFLFIGSAVTIVTLLSVQCYSRWCCRCDFHSLIATVARCRYMNVMLSIQIHASESSKRQLKLTLPICYHFERTKFIVSNVGIIMWQNGNKKANKTKNPLIPFIVQIYRHQRRRHASKSIQKWIFIAFS